jgi:hypothetical protein
MGGGMEKWPDSVNILGRVYSVEITSDESSPEWGVIDDVSARPGDNDNIAS